MAIDRGAVRRLVEMTRSEANKAAPDSLLIVPLGATEQHGPHLPVGTDSLLVEAVAERAVLALRDSFPMVLAPTLPVGSSAHHVPFGGTLSMTSLSFYGVLMDIGRSAASSGFRRMFYLNGHGGNSAVQQFALEWAADHPGCRVLFHNWWNAPRTWAKVQAIDPVASHGSWMENFPWTRLPGANVPDAPRPMVDMARVRALDPVALRQYLGDGNFGGLYQRSDDEMLALWQIAVDETRALLAGSWGEGS